MKGLSVKWQKLIIWLTGFLNIIAFVIAGGYLYKNTEHEEIKNSAKAALIATAVFTAVDIIRAIIQYCIYLAEASATWLNKTGWVIAIIKTVAFVVLFIVDLTVGFGAAEKTGKTAEHDAAKPDGEE